jgi:lipopolysaccharide export system permease protein
VKIIYRSIFSELLLAFVVSLPVLNLILMMDKVMKLSRILSSVGASPVEMFLVVLYTQPEVLLVTIPLGFLFSVLYTYGRMNADNELLVLRGSGMSFAKIARPVFALGVICALLGFLVSFELSPRGKKDSRIMVARILKEKVSRAIEPGTFSTLFKDTVIYADGSSGDTLKGVFISDERNKERPLAIYAAEGRVSAGEEDSLALFLTNGLIHIIKNGQMTMIYFGTYRLVLPFEIQSPEKRIGELTPGQLLKDARTQTGRKSVKDYLEFDKRLTFPLFSLAMMFLAPVLSLYSGKRARLGGIAMGTMVFTLYYIMLTNTERLAINGVIPHPVGGWLPLAIVFAVSLWAFWRVNRR